MTSPEDTAERYCSARPGFRLLSCEDAALPYFWLTLDADGQNLPSDWYLRLAKEITRMFHGEIKPSEKMPR